MFEFMDSSKTLIYLFFFIYFGFQIFSQMWGKYLQTGIPVSKNYIQNFINALVLIGLVFYFANPIIPLTALTSIVMAITFVFVFMYSYAKKAIDDECPKDKQNNVNSGKRSLTIILIIFYAILVLIYTLLYFTVVNRDERLMVLLGGVILCILYFSFYFFKNREQNENKFPLSLFLYPFLFLTVGVGQHIGLTTIYSILFTTVVALWGFFGVEWFVGPKREYEGTINKGMCKAYLGLSDDDTANEVQPQTQTQINKRNINYIYIAVSLIFVVFILALLFTFVSVKKIMNNY